MYPLSLETQIPPGAETGEQYMIQVTQQTLHGTPVGGAAIVYVAK